MRVLVVVPTYNERENVELLLPAVRESVPSADVLVVDDNSPDGTGDVVARLADELGQIDVVVAGPESRDSAAPTGPDSSTASITATTSSCRWTSTSPTIRRCSPSCSA